jgi:hypothetical protein
VCVCVCVKGFFKAGSCRTICQGCLWTMIHLISASWVARITGMSHQCLAFSTAFNTYPYILYLLILSYAILLMLCHSLFLSSFPKFHRVVPLLQTCSTSEFVYDHVCFCIYVYLWICLPHTNIRL